MARSWVSASRSDRQVRKQRSSTSRVTARLLLHCRGRVLARTASRSAERRLGERNGPSCPLHRQDGREPIELQRPPGCETSAREVMSSAVGARQKAVSFDPPSAAARGVGIRQANALALSGLARSPCRYRDRPNGRESSGRTSRRASRPRGPQPRSVHQEMGRGIRRHEQTLFRRLQGPGDKATSRSPLWV